MFLSKNWILPCNVRHIVFLSKKYILRISAVLICIWESQFSSVSGQFVRLEDIFNIVVYGEISSGLHSSVIRFVLEYC